MTRRKRVPLKRSGSLQARGPGDALGVVLPLEMLGSGLHDVSYTLPIRIGSTNPQNLSVQVDTGSSDLWLASTSCSATPCTQTRGRLYNPAESNNTGETFSISYLRGSVGGPIVWDQVEIGNYIIPNQAFAAADSVSDEPLSSSFSGVLGLAFPENSIISDKIPPGETDRPDGAVLPSNLFGISPESSSPSSHFLSLSLARPGSDRIKSYLGVGAHPPDTVPDPSAIVYTPVNTASSRLWKTTIDEITVWVDGQPKSVALGRSAGGGPSPEAVLDSGVPLILTTSSIANGIYGALGVGPASDGRYYLPCETPLNITITLNNRQPISLHPLDLTAPPSNDASSKNCEGLIFVDDNHLSGSNNLGDVVLGVPFLRNTYFVMAWEAPDSKGEFTSVPNTGAFRPHLGLLPLTDPTTALSEFHTVRVLNQPIVAPTPVAATQGRRTNIGIHVLIGVVSFFGLCFLLFAARWFLARRAKGAGESFAREPKSRGKGPLFGLKRRSTVPKESQDPTEEQLRVLRFERYQKERVLSEYTMSSGRTKVDGDEEAEFGYRDPVHKLGASGSKPNLAIAGTDPWDPQTALPDWRDTLVGDAGNQRKTGEGEEFEPYKEYPITYPLPPLHNRPSSEFGPGIASAGASTPLLTHSRDESELGGTPLAARGASMSSLPRLAMSSLTSVLPPAPPGDLSHPIPTVPMPMQLRDSYVSESPIPPPPPKTDEFGMLVDTDVDEEAPVMTGIGTAMRGKFGNDFNSKTRPIGSGSASVGGIFIPSAAPPPGVIP